jgi:predicted nucleotidyltransferase
MNADLEDAPFSSCYNAIMDFEKLFSSEEIERFCQKHSIRQLSFFGSVVRDDFSSQSDIDVLVGFEPGHTPGFDFFLIEDELSQLLGRKVDLQTVTFLSLEIRQSVLFEAVPVYEQA